MSGGMPRRRLIAHRGHSVGAPEQTIAAYDAAIRLGADMIEADVRPTRDGVLVLLHDATLDRTTDASGPISELTLRELADVDAGSWFEQAFAGERIPTVDTLFDLAERSGVALCLEAKGESADEMLEVALQAGRMIERRGRLGTDVLASFDHAALAEAGRRIPGLALAPDRLPERGPTSTGSLLDQARAIGARIVQHHHLDLTPEVVSGVQAAGVEVWAWPVTRREDVVHCHAMGTIGLMGDDVGVLVQVVNDKGLDITKT
jgi:glycerophosphoryl diester phosphodiesterase